MVKCKADLDPHDQKSLNPQLELFGGTPRNLNRIQCKVEEQLILHTEVTMNRKFKRTIEDKIVTKGIF